MKRVKRESRSFEQTLRLVFGTKKSKKLTDADHLVRLLQQSFLHDENKIEPPARIEGESDDDYFKHLEQHFDEIRRIEKMNRAAWEPFFEECYQAIHAGDPDYFESIAKAIKWAKRKPDDHQKAIFHYRYLWRSNDFTTKKELREWIIEKADIDHEDSVDWQRVIRELKDEFTEEYRELMGLESGEPAEWKDVCRELGIRDLDDKERWPEKRIVDGE